MPFTVQDLLEGRPKPTTITRTESVQAALKLMIEGEYSQLPVVSGEEKAEGMITTDSIVRALNHFELTIKQMRVSHAMIAGPKFRPDDDLFNLLDDLKDSYAAVVVDADDRAIGIVTSYDATEYFRRRGEDFMLVEDIESMLKDYVLAAFADRNGEPNLSMLEDAIRKITPSDNESRKSFQRAITRYLDLCSNGQLQMDSQMAQEVFERHVSSEQTIKPFEKLTLDDYIKLFLSKERWGRYKAIMDLDPECCRTLLQAVRNTRNELAHFRAEITAEKRDELRFCKDWLARHYQEVLESLDDSPHSPTENLEEEGSEEGPITGKSLLNLVRKTKDWRRHTEVFPVQLVKEDDSSESRYTPLAIYLQSLLSETKVELAFRDIEAIIGSELPKYARTHRSWWANDSTSHVQSKQWLDAGWRVGGIDMLNERVVFSRIKEREKAYVDFYSQLISGLQGRNEIPVRNPGTLGASWITITDLRPRGITAYIGCSFARGDAFRVELYIDGGEKELNKETFDALYLNREEIEALLSEKIAWERLDGRRASRVAVYHPGTITDEEEKLANLRTWAIEVVLRFYKVFKDQTENIKRRIETELTVSG